MKYLIVVALLLLTACNTVTGAGEDVIDII